VGFIWLDILVTWKKRAWSTCVFGQSPSPPVPRFPTPYKPTQIHNKWLQKALELFGFKRMKLNGKCFHRSFLSFLFDFFFVATFWYFPKRERHFSRGRKAVEWTSVGNDWGQWFVSQPKLWPIFSLFKLTFISNSSS